MSKVVFKINKEIPMSHSYSMKNFHRAKEKNSLNNKDNINFKKVTGSGIVGTSGLSPIIIYKKSSKGDENKEKYRVKKQIKNFFLLLTPFVLLKVYLDLFLLKILLYFHF